MIRKIFILTSTAGVFAFAGATAAQDPAPPTASRPTSPTTTQTSPPPQAGDYSPGATVTASDGAHLGVIDSVQVSASGEQTLNVRAADGIVKAIPSNGATVRNGIVAVTWTKAQFEAAAAVPEPMAEATPLPTRPIPTLPAPTPRTPETVPLPPASEDRPDVRNSPVDPPAQPRA